VTAAPSATVVAFTGAWQGRFEPSAFQTKAMRDVQFREEQAFRDARKIIAAKRDADNWMGRVLIAMLATMDDLQRARIGVLLAPQASEEARQASAVVRFATAGKAERRRIQAMLDRLQDGEAVQ
jgi:hypothetical protein